MSQRITVRRYAAGIFAAGCLVLAALAPMFSFSYVKSHTAAFALLAAGVLLSELLPLQIPRRGNDEQITLSTSFSFALLLTAGVWPALVTQAVASVIQDLISGKPGWRVRFNVGQYTLSMAAAYGVLRAFSGAPHVGSARPFTGGELPVVLLAAAVFFVVNTSVVGTAVARYQNVPIGRYFRNDALFTAITGAVLLCLAPIVVATAVYATALVPLLMAPIVAIYRAGRLAARTEYVAHHDELTELPNRVAFHQAVDEAIEGDCGSSCVLLMDLNRFKEVNDTLGHRYGDMLLERIADRLQQQLREDDQVARLGGDEFAVFRKNVGAQTALKLGKAVTESLRASFELDEFVVDAEASVGISLYPQDGADAETLLQKADVAMYRAKDTHTSMALYDETHDHHSPAKLALTADLRSAIAAGQLDVWFQPMLDLRTDRVPAVEALVRWQHPALGLLLPAAFLNMAEHTSLIKPLTQRVLELALSQMAGWRASGIDVAVAVNVSTRVLVESDFSERVAAALEDARVPPERLKLEVTESALMADPATTHSILQRLTQLGVEISIDDFGTGYSSLAYLADLPVSEVKIDRSFVTRMATGSREEVIVRSTVDLGHHLGLRVVAEGAEERATLQKLRTLGCDLVQGYAVGQAMATQDATRWLRKAQRRPRRLAPTAGEAA